MHFLLFRFSEWNKIKGLDTQIDQVKASIAAKKSYYAVIDSKVEALNAAGWSTKEKSIEVNFSLTPFFIPKINNFFQTIVPTAGMKVVAITSSAAASVKGASQTTQQSTVKSSKTTETTTAVQETSSSYFNQLQGPINKTTINLTVAGTYNAFKNLLTIFENQTRIITVKNITVSAAGQEKGVNNLTFAIVLDVYSY